MAGKLSLEKLITHTMPLDKINEAFDVMFAGKRFVTKQIVAFTVNIISLSMFILLYEKFLQFDWLRAVVFQLNLKYLHVKITKLLRVVV